MKLKFYTLVISALFFGACSSDDEDIQIINNPTTTTVTDVYVGGTLDKNAVYWKNNEMIQLTSSTANVVEEVVGMFVSSNGDVHAIGKTANGGAYWLNGNKTDLSFDPIKLYVSANGDVYILGHQEYLKNNVTTVTGFINEDFSIVGEDVHIVGALSNKPYYYLNGTLTELSNNSLTSWANGIEVNDGDVYIVGQMRAEAGSNNFMVSYWLNGNRTDLTSVNEDCYAYDMKVNNGNVHIVGSYYNTANGEYGGAHWINNSLQPIVNGSEEYYSVDIKNNKVYIAGDHVYNGNNIYVYGYWLDGNWISLNEVNSATYFTAWSSAMFVRQYQQ